MLKITTVLVTLGLLAACADGPDTRPAAPEPKPAPTAEGTTSAPAETSPPAASATPKPARRGTEIVTSPSDYGPMLFDGADQAIYLFDKETTTRAECFGPCAEAWPPVLTNGLPRANGRTRVGLLGTTRRPDGTRQVTYAGHPLYYYAHEGPGQVLCHNVEEFGGLWLVVRPDGTPAP